MKRYVHERTENRDDEDLQVVIVYERKQKPLDYKYVVFTDIREE